MQGCDAVTHSSAIPARNIELEAARATGIPALHRSRMLAGMKRLGPGYLVHVDED